MTWDERMIAIDLFVFLDTPEIPALVPRQRGKGLQDPQPQMLGYWFQNSSGCGGDAKTPLISLG